MQEAGSGGGGHAVVFVGNTTKDGVTEYQIKVTPPVGESWFIRRRYREVRELHDHLKLEYPERLPQVPRKKLFGNTDPKFIQTRQTDLQAYFNTVLQIDVGCRVRALRKFLEIEKQLKAAKPAPSPNHNQIIEKAQGLLIDLGQTPSTLETTEISQRVHTYSQAMKTYVLNQPVDTALASKVEVGMMPAKFIGYNGDASATTPKDEVLSDTLQKLLDLTNTRRSIAHVEDLIVRFPDMSDTSKPRAE